MLKNFSIIKGFLKIPFILQIIIGLIFGIILAALYPHDQTVLPTIGHLFVKALKSIAPILVFILVSSAIAQHKQGQETHMRPIIFVYFINMILSATLALVMSFCFPSTFHVLANAVENVSPPMGVQAVFINFLNQAIENPISAFVAGNYISILVWATLFGVALRLSHESTKILLEDLAQCVGTVVRFIIRFAPLGVMGLIYSSCTMPGGFANLLNYMHVLTILVVTMLLVAFVINPLLVFICTKENPYPLILTCLSESAVTAFFTRSSAANIPVNLALCERLKLPKATYSIAIPLGCTINMAGAAVTIVVMTMAAVHTLGIETSFIAAWLMCIVAVLCACGTSGIAGGSLMLVPLACSIFGISNDIAMQVVGIGFIISVLQDSVETALNSSTDVIITAAICRRIEKQKT